jgi:hypothetical protein
MWGGGVYMSLTGENEQTEGAIAGSLLINYHSTPLTNIEPVISDANIFPLKKTYKNLLIISLSFLLMFTAYNGLTILQSSLNTEQNVGVNSLTIITATSIVSIDYFFAKRVN